MGWSVACCAVLLGTICYLSNNVRKPAVHGFSLYFFFFDAKDYGGDPTVVLIYIKKKANRVTNLS